MFWGTVCLFLIKEVFNCAYSSRRLESMMLDQRYLSRNSWEFTTQATQPVCVDQVGLQLAATLLPHPSECWDSRHMLPHPTNLLLTTNYMSAKSPTGGSWDLTELMLIQSGFNFLQYCPRHFLGSTFGVLSTLFQACAGTGVHASKKTTIMTERWLQRKRNDCRSHWKHPDEKSSSQWKILQTTLLNMELDVLSLSANKPQEWESNQPCHLTA